VDLRSGSYCVKQALPQLKVAKEWLVPVERVFGEIGYLRIVQRIAPGQVPRMVGEDHASKSFVMEFLGPEFRNWKSDLLAGRIDSFVAREVGDLLGRIHAATADDAQFAKQFANDSNFFALRLDPYLVEAARMHPALAHRLQAIVERTAGTRRVLVHGDVSPKNILVGPRGPVLLDAECAWFGDPAFDLAFCLNHFLLKAAHLPAHIDPLMACFDAMQQAYFGHVSWEPKESIAARVASLLPGLVLARVDGKSPGEYLGEPTRQAVRRIAIDLLQQERQSLDAIASNWILEFKS
jgi:5-methylthioribose kinase